MNTRSHALKSWSDRPAGAGIPWLRGARTRERQIDTVIVGARLAGLLIGRPLAEHGVVGAAPDLPSPTTSKDTCRTGRGSRIPAETRRLRLPATYLLPIRSHEPPAAELTHYLREISEACDVIVVDGSEAPEFAAAHDAWSTFALHVPPDTATACINGKVRGVLTGLRLCRTDRVVIADDDIRYDLDSLARVIDELESADVVVPQNYFDPLPWHARWDTARTLVNRATGGDFPGTLGVRTAVLRAGYDGDVLFENLELMRTATARGGTCRRVPGLYVRRIPPTTRHFLGQRVRQAYDEFGRPVRCAFWLSVLPATVLIGRRHGGVGLLAIGLASMSIAEIGRRRSGGSRHFPVSATALAPLWIAERAVCSWIAVAVRFRGGVTYGGRRVTRAATPVRRLRTRPATAA